MGSRGRRRPRPSLAAVLFVLRERSAPHPMLDLSLVARPLVSSGLAYKAAAGLAIAGLGYLVTLQLQLDWGWPPALAAVGMLPQVAVLLAGAAFVSPFVRRVGLERAAWISASAVVLGLAVYALLGTARTSGSPSRWSSSPPASAWSASSPASTSSAACRRTAPPSAPPSSTPPPRSPPPSASPSPAPSSPPCSPGPRHRGLDPAADRPVPRGDHPLRRRPHRPLRRPRRSGPPSAPTAPLLCAKPPAEYRRCEAGDEPRCGTRPAARPQPKVEPVKGIAANSTHDDADATTPSAEEGTRTPMPFRTDGFEPSAYAIPPPRPPTGLPMATVSVPHRPAPSLAVAGLSPVCWPVAVTSAR